MKSTARTLAALVTVLSIGGHAYAATVTDVYTSDSNVITSVIAINDPVGFGRTGVNVVESYGESTLIPYTSHDGYAVVNPQQQFFDKNLTITQSDKHTDWDSMYINLQVTNNTPYRWSDFHVEFFNADSTTPFGITLLNVNGTGLYGNSIFDQTTVNPFQGKYDFWSNTAGQDPGQTNNLWFRWDWGNPLEPYPVGYTIGIRQIATTVPEPETYGMMLAGLGLLGILAWRRKKIMF